MMLVSCVNHQTQCHICPGKDVMNESDTFDTRVISEIDDGRTYPLCIWCPQSHCSQKYSRLVEMLYVWQGCEQAGVESGIVVVCVTGLWASIESATRTLSRHGDPESEWKLLHWQEVFSCQLVTTDYLLITSSALLVFMVVLFGWSLTVVQHII